MNKPDLVGVHEAGITHHVAAIGKVYSQNSAASILHRAGTVIVQFLVVVSVDVAPGKHLFNMREKLRIDSHHVFEVAMDRTLLYHPDLTIALNLRSFNLAHSFIPYARNFF